jgi:hypothetical protein
MNNYAIILGALLPLGIWALKTKYPQINKMGWIAAVLAISFVGGALFYFFGETAFWTASLSILATSQTIYALLIKHVATLVEDLKTDTG